MGNSRDEDLDASPTSSAKIVRQMAKAKGSPMEKRWLAYAANDAPVHSEPENILA